MIESDMENTYRDSDLNRSAAIWAAGGEFVGLERRSHRTFSFLFSPQDRCEGLARRFEQGDLLVNASQMVDCLNKLKDVIFSRLRERDRDDAPRLRDAT